MAVLDILNRYRSDPDYNIPSWHDISLKLMPKKGDPFPSEKLPPHITSEVL